MTHRWMMIAAESGEVRHVEPFTKLAPAKKRADAIAAEMFKGKDHVVIWDLALGKAIYDPLGDVDLYPSAY